MNELKEGQNYTQCIEFITDFHSPVEDEEVKDTAWEKDKEYTDYQWWLARTDGGEWELLTWGY
jgi:D-alanyl-D-alanine carboxypeptidase